MSTRLFFQFLHTSETLFFYTVKFGLRKLSALGSVRRQFFRNVFAHARGFDDSHGGRKNALRLLHAKARDGKSPGPSSAGRVFEPHRRLPAAKKTGLLSLHHGGKKKQRVHGGNKRHESLFRPSASARAQPLHGQAAMRAYVQAVAAQRAGKAGTACRKTFPVERAVTTRRGCTPRMRCTRSCGAPARRKDGPKERKEGPAGISWCNRRPSPSSG